MFQQNAEKSTTFPMLFNVFDLTPTYSLNAWIRRNFGNIFIACSAVLFDNFTHTIQLCMIWAHFSGSGISKHTHTSIQITNIRPLDHSIMIKLWQIVSVFVYAIRAENILAVLLTLHLVKLALVNGMNKNL